MLQLTEEGALAAVQAVVKKQHMANLELNENQISSQGVRQVKVSCWQLTLVVMTLKL